MTLQEDIYKRHSRAEFVRVKLSTDRQFAQKKQEIKVRHGYPVLHMRMHHYTFQQIERFSKGTSVSCPYSSMNGYILVGGRSHEWEQTKHN